MNARASNFWDRLRSSFWFIPAVLSAAACLLSFVTIYIDQQSETQYEAYWLFPGGPEGARELLGTVGSSMITVAGVVFSITIVSLTLASQQFGPRLLRNFLRDRGNQIVLGTFIATYLFCLLILRRVTGTSDHVEAFVPVVSITTCVALAVLSLAVLIYFIHHVSSSMHASNVIAAVTRELQQVADRALETNGTPSQSEIETFDSVLELDPQVDVDSNRNGYLQTVDYQTVLKELAKHSAFGTVLVRPGDFLMEGTRLICISGVENLSEEMAGRYRSCFIVGSQRTTVQDIGFAIDQLVEVAVRALSPGVNDPFTAMSCMDRLGQTLSYLAKKGIPSPYFFDSERKLRMKIKNFSFEDATDASFHLIRQYGHTSAAVMMRALEIILEVGRNVTNTNEKAALVRHAVWLRNASKSVQQEEPESDLIQERFRRTMEVLTSERV